MRAPDRMEKMCTCLFISRRGKDTRYSDSEILVDYDINVGEITAIMRALQWLRDSRRHDDACTEVHIFADSDYTYASCQNRRAFQILPLDPAPKFTTPPRSFAAREVYHLLLLFRANRSSETSRKSTELMLECLLVSSCTNSVRALMS